MQELLKHFHELSLHPRNAKDLKGLILQLAIQGKLTADWRVQNSESISGQNGVESLLKNIGAEKAKLIKEGVIRKNHKSLSVSNDEKYLEIPKDWSWIRIGDLGDFYNGDSINKNVKASKYEGLEEGYPYIGTKDVGYGFEKLIYDNGVRIPYAEEKYKVAKPGAILICSEGGSAGKKCGLVTENICFGNKLYAIEPFGNIESLLILALYQTPAFQDQFKSRMTGIIGGISKNNFKDIPIPIAPLNEQKIISSRIETLFKEVEALENLTEKRIELKKDYATSALSQLAKNDSKVEWQALKLQFHDFFNEVDNIKKLRETILQLAVQGKLTANWRAQNPELISGENSAENLLKEIKAEKEQLIKEKLFQKPRQKGEIKNGEFEHSIPENWTYAKIVDIAFVTKLAGFEYTKYINLTDDGEVPVIRAQNVKMNRIDETALKFIDLKTSKQLYRCALINPSILMTFIGAGIGDVAIFDKKERWHLAPNVAKLEPFNNKKEKINIKYLLFYLMSPVGQSQIFKHSKATAQPSLSMGTIRDAIIVLPSIKEQNIIVKKVDSLLNLCDQLKKKIETGQQQIEDLMQSVLKEVFEGDNKINEVSVI